MGHHVVVGVDGSESSKAALGWAIRQARLTGAAVDAVIAWQYPMAYTYPIPMPPETTAKELARRVLDQAIYEVGEQVPEHAEITPKVVEGHPARVLVDAAEDADLLVVGSRGHGGFVGALLGSTGQHCVHHATCPVVVIRDSVTSAGGPPSA